MIAGTTMTIAKDKSKEEVKVVIGGAMVSQQLYLNIVRGGVPASQCKPGKHASRLAVQQCAIKKNNNPAKQCQNPTILELYTIYTYYS